MNKKDLSVKLAATEASLKRWQTRFKRASTMIHKLDKQRRRYQLQLLNPDQPVIATVKVRVPVETDHLSEAEFAKMAKSKRQQKLTSSPVEKSTIDVAEVQRQVNAAIEGFTPQKIADVAAVAHEKIPDFLNRAADPLLAEKMTQARRKDEEDDRRKMPLTDRAALQFIKKGDKKKKAR